MFSNPNKIYIKVIATITTIVFILTSGLGDVFVQVATAGELNPSRARVATAQNNNNDHIGFNIDQFHLPAGMGTVQCSWTPSNERRGTPRDERRLSSETLAKEEGTKDFGRDSQRNGVSGLGFRDSNDKPRITNHEPR